MAGVVPTSSLRRKSRAIGGKRIYLPDRAAAWGSTGGCHASRERDEGAGVKRGRGARLVQVWLRSSGPSDPPRRARRFGEVFHAPQMQSAARAQKMIAGNPPMKPTKLARMKRMPRAVRTMCMDRETRGRRPWFYGRGPAVRVGARPDGSET